MQSDVSRRSRRDVFIGVTSDVSERKKREVSNMTDHSSVLSFSMTEYPLRTLRHSLRKGSVTQEFNSENCNQEFMFLGTWDPL